MPNIVQPYAPWAGRNIGIEFEINKRHSNRTILHSRSLKTAVERALADVGASSHLLNSRIVEWYKSDGSTWDVKTDSTSGWEVASRALQLNAEGHNEELARVCHHFGLLNPSVDSKCGTHIHIEASDLNWQQIQNLVWLWARYEPFWFSLVPPFRRQRSHCAPICTYELDGRPTGDWDEVRRIITGSQYTTRPTDWPRASLNLIPWWHSGRVEVRLHHGTISYQDVREWAMLMLALVARAKTTNGVALEPYEPRPRVRAIDTEYVGAVLGIREQNAHPVSRELMQWIESRRIRFNPEESSMRLDQDPLGRIQQIARGEQSTRPRRRTFTVTGPPVTQTTPTGARILGVPDPTTQQLLRENASYARGRRRR